MNINYTNNYINPNLENTTKDKQSRQKTRDKEEKEENLIDSYKVKIK